MKRIGIVTALSLLLSLCATVAMADTLQNRFGVTGRFGFLGRAEPSPATALVHFNSGVKSLVLHVINPLTVAINVSLNRTIW